MRNALIVAIMHSICDSLSSPDHKLSPDVFRKQLREIEVLRAAVSSGYVKDECVSLSYSRPDNNAEWL